MDILLYAVLAITFATLLLVIRIMWQAPPVDTSAFSSQMDTFGKNLERMERVIREEAAQDRTEFARSAKDQRQELTDSIKSLGDSAVNRMGEASNLQKTQLESFSGQLKERLEYFSSQLTTFAEESGKRLDAAREEAARGSKELRGEVVQTLSKISEEMRKTLEALGSGQNTRLEQFENRLTSFAKTSGEKLDTFRHESAAMGKQLRDDVVTTLEKLSSTLEKTLDTLKHAVDGKLQNIQENNSKQLEQMRQTVEEKLQRTLEKRLGESFKQVSERLEQVHKGLGEMQSLATGVGDLKKVLANVKTRGTWGEVQLGALLEQALSPDQYDKNVSTGEGSERVEYAIRLPGHSDDPDKIVWLPIDAKFPLEDYQRLVDAQELANTAGVEDAGKQLENRIKMSARDISEKYLNPPRTTDFGILFVPIEGLYAEIIRRAGLVDAIQRDSRVVLAGPTTLWAILNSLQMGFRTLAIQKRSSEVWNLLSEVKNEWAKYSDVLDKVQKKLTEATNTIEKAKVRSRAVDKKLRHVQGTPAGDTVELLPHGMLDTDDGGDVDENADG